MPDLVSGGIKVDSTLLDNRLKALARANPKAFRKAETIAAIQFLNWSNNGSTNTSKKPPIKWGVLRGSSSAFVGNKLVDTFKQRVDLRGMSAPTPADAHRAKPTTMTWVWNTDYATKMHEWKGGWGEATIRDGDAGNKWIEEHLQSDRNDLWAIVAKEFGKAVGL